MKTYNYLGVDCTLRTSRYANGTLAIILEYLDSEEDERDVISVNLAGNPFQDERTFHADENNHEGIGEWLEENGIAEFTGVISRSGFCQYPLYRLKAEI